MWRAARPELTSLPVLRPTPAIQSIPEIPKLIIHFDGFIDAGCEDVTRTRWSYLSCSIVTSAFLHYTAAFNKRNKPTHPPPPRRNSSTCKNASNDKSPISTQVVIILMSVPKGTDQSFSFVVSLRRQRAFLQLSCKSPRDEVQFGGGNSFWHQEACGFTFMFLNFKRWQLPANASGFSYRHTITCLIFRDSVWWRSSFSFSASVNAVPFIEMEQRWKLLFLGRVIYIKFNCVPISMWVENTTTWINAQKLHHSWEWNSVRQP